IWGGNADKICRVAKCAARKKAFAGKPRREKKLSGPNLLAAIRSRAKFTVGKSRRKGFGGQISCRAIHLRGISRIAVLAGPLICSITSPTDAKPAVGLIAAVSQPLGSAKAAATWSVVKISRLPHLRCAAGAGPRQRGLRDPGPATASGTTIKPRVTHTGQDDVYLVVQYTPREEGLHSVNVFFAGQQIPRSPFGVDVAGTQTTFPDGGCTSPARHPAQGSSRVKQTRAELLTCSVENAGEGRTALGRSSVQAQSAPAAAVAACGNEPCKVKVGAHGRFGLHAACTCRERRRGTPSLLNFGPQEVPSRRSRWTWPPQQCRAYIRLMPRPGGGWVGERGHLHRFSIEGPSEAQIQCSDNGDGSADVVYYPTAPGEYAVHVLCNEQDIPRSPFMPGPGIGVPEAVPLAVGQPAPFTLDTRNTNGPPELVAAAVYNPPRRPIPLDMRQQAPGLLQCSYVPQEPGKHTATVSYAGVSTSGSPFRAFVAEPVRPDLVQASGPGLERAVRNQPTFFNIDCSRAGPGDVGVGVRAEPSGQELPVVPHLVNVMFAGQPAAGGPFPVPVDPDIEVDKVRVDGLEPTIPLGVPHEFDILTAATLAPSQRPGAAARRPPIQRWCPRRWTATLWSSRPACLARTPWSGICRRRLPQSPMRTNVVPQQQPVDEALMSRASRPRCQHSSSRTSSSSPVWRSAAGRSAAAPHSSSSSPSLALRSSSSPSFGAPQQQQPQFGAPQQVAPQRAAHSSSSSPSLALQRAAPQQQAAGDGGDDWAAAPDSEAVGRLRAPAIAIAPRCPAPRAAPNVRAYGDGLSKAATGIPARFTIDSRDAPNIPLGVNVEGPSKADIAARTTRDGTPMLTTRSGTVSGSPFTVTAVRSGYEGVDPKKVRAFGPGLQPHGEEPPISGLPGSSTACRPDLPAVRTVVHHRNPHPPSLCPLPPQCFAACNSYACVSCYS
uniref:Actin-binding cytoskeleton protein filamin n=1 Tax=Macrostomum lignano TaxID=282301 RepID=A0A1I8F7N5_9PLAT